MSDCIILVTVKVYFEMALPQLNVIGALLRAGHAMLISFEAHKPCQTQSGNSYQKKNSVLRSRLKG